MKPFHMDHLLNVFILVYYIHSIDIKCIEIYPHFLKMDYWPALYLIHKL
jgi:hypothetical protein